MAQIDWIARVVGYLAISAAAVWFVSFLVKDFVRQRHERFEHDRLNMLAKNDPKAFELYMRNVADVDRWREERLTEIERLKRELGHHIGR